MIFDEYYIKSRISLINDWPKPGVKYRDLTPIYADPKATRMVTDVFIQRYIDYKLTHIAVIDARGFIIGSTIAYGLNLPLILIRKPGKLPGDVFKEDYKTEYSDECLEIKEEKFEKDCRILLFDDLIATGGTLMAATALIERLDGNVIEAASIIDLPELKGSSELQDANVPTFSLIGF